MISYFWMLRVVWCCGNNNYGQLAGLSDNVSDIQCIQYFIDNDLRYETQNVDQVFIMIL